MVETDHKPLEMISLKNLISTPVRLQRMLLWLQQYDMVIMYWPGKEMLLADALSCLPSWANNSEIKLDLWVDAISISALASSWLTKTANKTQKDPILSTMHWLTLNGWPRIWRHIPSIACNYWDFRDELSIEGDLLMKGERIIIPTVCRDSILADLHKSHKGAYRSLSLARTCVYWPGMEADIMDYIKRCVTCINNAKMPVETLHPVEVPTGPWVKLGMDFFQDDSGNKFLIVADYFSKFPLIFPVASTHHHKMLRYLRDLFSTEGIPAIVMTDNGPPFNGEDCISISAFSSSQLTKTVNETQKDPILLTVHQCDTQWMAKNLETHTQDYTNYWDFRDELSIEGDLLMKGERIIIPTMCRDSILADLHKSHEGANRSLSLARTCIYWLGMEADVLDYIKRCVTCIDNAKMPVETLHPHKVPTRPWVKLGMDFFQDDSGNKFLIVADYFSKFPFIFPGASTHHHKMLRYLRDLLLTERRTHLCNDRHRTILSMVKNSKRFAREFDFKHQMSSPTFPSIKWFHRGNGEESENLPTKRQMDLLMPRQEHCYSYVIHH